MYAARRLVYDFAQRTELRLGRDDGDVDADFLRDGHQRLSQSWEIFFAREVPEDRSLSATCGSRDLLRRDVRNSSIFNELAGSGYDLVSRA